MAFKTLLYELRDGVAHITLNRPEAANALNLDMGRDLMEVALRCDEDPAVRAVLIRANGKMFCAGGDLASFGGAGEDLSRLLKELTTYLHAGVSRFARMRAPVIAAVQGSAAGAGFSLAAAADLILAAESARFVVAYTAVGLSPDGSSTYFLPRLVGARRAMELMMTNRVLKAPEALAWGLVNRVVEDGKLAGEAEALARTLADGPTNAFGSVKRLLLEGAADTLETQMENEARRIADIARTKDAREGISAFLKKRAPRFAGS
ncbi:MAG: enoyl-CoA hydratase/isomerase family protein [Myxococcota bacterium]